MKYSLHILLNASLSRGFFCAIILLDIDEEFYSPH
nr:MAG TPA: hypothetical protein [Caudoviricetes sp.]